MRIRDVMTTEVIALRPGDGLRQAVSVFAKNRISGAPVVDGKGRVVGILTEMDILRRLELGAMEVGQGKILHGRTAMAPEKGSGFHLKSLSEALETAANLTVANLMTSPVVTAGPDDLVREKVALMVYKRIRRIPVVDKKGVLVGILSRKDLIHMLDGASRRESRRQASLHHDKKKANRRARGKRDG